jgi:hypothetical protein
MNTLRKAKISKYPDGSGGFTVEVYFHKWGQQSNLTEGNVITELYAIIEHSDGRIELVHPNRVKLEPLTFS